MNIIAPVLVGACVAVAILLTAALVIGWPWDRRSRSSDPPPATPAAACEYPSAAAAPAGRRERVRIERPWPQAAFDDRLPVHPRVQKPIPFGILGRLDRVDASNTTSPLTLPLLGRRTGYRSSRFHYKTRKGASADGSPAMDYSVSFDGRDCTDDRGCPEIVGEKTVIVNPFGAYLATPND